MTEASDLEEMVVPEEIQPKPRFSVPDNVYTPVEIPIANQPENGGIGGQQPQPTFPNGSPMTQAENITEQPDVTAQDAMNVFTPQAQAQPGQPAAQPNVQPNAPIVKEPSFLERSKLDYETAQNKFKNAKNEDKGWKGGLLEGVQNFLHSMGESYRMNPRANWKEVLAGGAIGTGLGFVDRSWNERRKYQQEAKNALGNYQTAATMEKFDNDLKNSESLRNDRTADNERQAKQFSERERRIVEEAKKRFDNRMKELDKKAEIDGRKWKRRVDEEGKVWMDYQNGKSEPFMNPENPTEQDIDPNYKLYDVFSPVTGTQVKLKGAEIYRGESQINTANTNIQNAGLSDQQTYDTKVSKLNGDIAASSSKISSLEADLGKLQNAQYDDEIKKRDSIEKELRDERARLSGFQTELKSLPKPSQRKTVNSGGRYSGQVFPSPKALKTAFPGKSEAEIRQIIEANGGKFQD